MDFTSFFWGFIFCMFADVFFAIADFFIQKSFTLRNQRRSKKDVKTL